MELLGGLGAASVVGCAKEDEKKVTAQEAPPQPEQPLPPATPELNPNQAEKLRVFNEGMRLMRESAEHEKEEIARAFTDRLDGTFEWIEIPMLRVGGHVGEGGDAFAAYTQDPKVLERVAQEVRNGAVVTQYHTHPLRALVRENQSPLEGADRLPPSPEDIMANLVMSNSLKGSTGVLAHAVVAPAGIWSYKALSDEVIERFKQAVEAGAREMQMVSTSDAEAALRYLSHSSLNETTKARLGTATATQLLSEIQSLPDILDLWGRTGASIIAHDPSMDSKARVFFVAAAKAQGRMLEELRKIAPQTDGEISSYSFMHDTKSYVRRWNELGILMEFHSFDK